MARDRESNNSEGSTASNGNSIELDAIVVGAGFSGIAALYKLRKLGYKVKIFEAGGDFGGTWYWNRYPGARVDSEFPFYQLNIPEVYKTWNYNERFPDHRELRRYMKHVANTLDLYGDAYFDARVVDATWDKAAGRWTIKTQQGHVASAKYLLLCVGVLNAAHTPDFPGLQDFRGEVIHSASWPEDYSPKGKSVGLVGAGATAVQITQELGKEANELTVFVRRPSLCIPIQNRKVTMDEQKWYRHLYPALMAQARNSFVGIPVTRRAEGVQQVSKEERERHFDEKWETGGFNFQQGGFSDVILNKESNQIVYEYWRRRVCERLTDKEKAKIMAPEEKPFYFATKRAPLETDYYDVLNQPNVHIHDLKAAPLAKITEKGILTADGKEYEFDTLVLATGFDAFVGAMSNLGLKNKDGVLLKDIWANGISTYMGLTMAGFPNLFMSYTPQAPTVLANGPVLIEAQIDLSVKMIQKLDSEGAHSIEATEEGQEWWADKCDTMINRTLYPYTNSWWQTTNAGRKSQNMIYVGGINTYEPIVREKMDGWQGYVVRKEPETETVKRSKV